MSLLPGGMQLGSLTLAPDVLGLILAVVAAMLWLKRDVQRFGVDGERVSGLFSGMLLVGMIASRLSAFVLEPEGAFRQPLFTLLNAGVPDTEWIGGLAALSYGAYMIKRNGLPGLRVLDAFARAGVLMFAVHALFDPRPGLPTKGPWAVTVGEHTYHPVNLYQAGIALLVLSLLWRLAKAETAGQGTRRALFWFGCGMLLTSFAEVRWSTMWGLTSQQWMWLLFAVVGYLAAWIQQGERRNQLPGK
jgi:prolipoprotein diacylglyceryltransferase